MDPVEFRIKNLPPEAPNAMWRTYYPIAAEMFGWSRRHPTGDPSPGPVKRGMGCAANQWGGGGRGSKAHCEINADGSVVMRCGTQDIGVGTRTHVTMVTAETLGIPMEMVKAEIGDSNYPFSGGSGGSTTSPSVAPAIRVTSGKARDALFARVAPTIGVDAAALVAVNGRIQSKDDASKGLSWKDACRLLGTEPVSVDGEWEAGLSASGTSGVQFAEVEVDIETGVTKVSRIVCVQDCGLILDRREPVHRRHGGGSQLRAVREPPARSQHGDHGEPQHGVLPAGRARRRPEDRGEADEPAGARRHRHRRAADDLDGGRSRERRPQCHRRDDQEPAPLAG
jgi:xanthine dehydrogenase YagR molybdenum-binding subunit